MNETIINPNFVLATSNSQIKTKTSSENIFFDIQNVNVYFARNIL